MQLYNDREKLRKDIYWLTHECSLPLFACSKLSMYSYVEFEKNFLQDIELDDKSILLSYEKLFELIGLKKYNWQDSISEENLPCVAIMPNDGACIVLEKNKGGTWTCASPNGIKYYSLFSDNTQFFQLRKTKTNETGKSAYEMFKSVALREKRHIFHAVMATLTINILALGTSLFSMQVYDRVIPTQGISTLIALTVGVAIAIILEMILKISRSAILDEATTSMDRSYSHNIFNRFLKIRSDALPNSIGTLSGQLQGYTSVRIFIATAALYFIIDFPFTLFFLSIIIMLGGFSMGLIPFIFFLLSLGTALFFKNKIEVLTELSVAANNKKLGLLVESVENAITIKANGASYIIQNKWNNLTEDAINDDISIRHFSELAVYTTALLQQFSYISLVAWGAYLVSTTDQLTMGGLIAISILSSRVLSPIAALPNIFIQWGRAKISIRDLDNIYALPQENEGITKPLFPNFLEPKYNLQSVKFAYKDSRQALNIPRLNIDTGEKIAILGTIGSGKSTMLKVLSGLYSSQEGHVLLGGLDIQHISRHKLSSIIGYLPQSTKLISGTLRDNLTLGLVGVDDSQILEASEKTGLNNLMVSAPKGLDTIIPEGGNSLSGGQKQLIAITRILIANPKIWLLDEPTANMDDFTENKIIEILNSQISKDQTLILVTHKPALLRLVNRIIVLTPQGIAMDGPKNLVLEKLTNNQKNRETVQNSTQSGGKQ